MNRLDELTRLLEDDEALEAYLDTLDATDVIPPDGLQAKILTRVKRRRKRLAADIAKIAACLVLSLSVSNAEFVISGADAELLEFTQGVEEKISDFYQTLSQPEFEKGSNPK